MKTYSGLKTVQAECCTLGDFIATAKRNPYEGSEQQPDNNTAGYKVVYEDGYVSWSPKDVFEKSYHNENLPFGIALEAVKCGKGMRLPKWSEDVVIRCQFPDEHSKMTAPYLYVESRFGRVPWKETMIELLSNEWQIVE